ncbi:MAG: hypothetical protein QOJ54_2952 [Aliidongia sp.]|nr:hypothetical protein [Aliidongia sp.]
MKKLSWKSWVGVLIGISIIVVIGGVSIANMLLPRLPEPQPVKQARWLDQNWSDADRYWYAHASQGTSTIPIPYKWFVSLAVPELSLFTATPLLSGAPYMTKLGFIPSPKSGENARAEGYSSQSIDPGNFALWNDGPVSDANPDGLPVGFAITKGYRNPVDGEMLTDQVGLTCAACHTGHLEYNGVSLRIDGANAAASLGKLTDSLGYSLALTKWLPWRFSAFAERVLGKDATSDQKKKLYDDLSNGIDNGLKLKAMTAATDKESTEEGFNRIDALNRIGNTVFFNDLLGAPWKDFDVKPNYVALTAPVKFPPLWDTPWFLWAQYDGSIMQPVVRNAGEAMGVAAKINMINNNPPAALWDSSINFNHLHEFEQLLAGPNPLKPDAQNGVIGFSGLRSPKWPADVLGPIDAGLAVKGRQLYGDLCQSCHLPPVNEKNSGIYDASLWTTPTEKGESYLKVPLVQQSVVGTDPNQEEVLIKRQVNTPVEIGVQQGVAEPDRNTDMVCFTKQSPVVTKGFFSTSLASAVEKAVDRFETLYSITSQKDDDAVRGARPNCVQALPVYKSRPLDGIWATPPYLHNGSVPSLYALLGSNPERDRPNSFCLGNRAYDPKKVGLDIDNCSSANFKFDTTLNGNSNRGHEFRNGASGPGIIGRALSEDERLALIAFLKTQ